MGSYSPGRLAIKINRNITRHTPAPKAPKKETNSHGPIRRAFESTVGVAYGAYKIPASIVSGALVGGYQGTRKGLDENYEITARSSALSHIAVSTAQGQLQAGVLGFMIGGPAGAVTNMALDAMSAAPGVYVFFKGGSAAETGERLSKALNEKVKPGEGLAAGLVKGVGAGVVSSTQAAAVTGYREGKGMASGIIEGAAAIPEEFGKLKRPEGPLLKAAVASAVGAASSVLSGAAGAVLPLVAGEAKETPSLLKRVAVTAGTGAAVGALVGSVGGPVGMAIGGGVGMLLNLAGPAPRKDFAEKVLESVKSQSKDQDDLGSEISNKNQALFQSVFVGLASGVTNGWNAVVSTPGS